MLLNGNAILVSFFLYYFSSCAQIARRHCHIFCVCVCVRTCVDLSHFYWRTKHRLQKDERREEKNGASKKKESIENRFSVSLCVVCSLRGGRWISSFFLFIQNKYLTYGRGDRAHTDRWPPNNKNTPDLRSNGKKLFQKKKYYWFVFAFCGDDVRPCHTCKPIGVSSSSPISCGFSSEICMWHTIRIISLVCVRDEMSLCFT